MIVGERVVQIGVGKGTLRPCASPRGEEATEVTASAAVSLVDAQAGVRGSGRVLWGQEKAGSSYCLCFLSSPFFFGGGADLASGATLEARQKTRQAVNASPEPIERQCMGPCWQYRLEQMRVLCEWLDFGHGLVFPFPS